MKIYTKTGDDGSTGLFDGRRVPKNDSHVKAYGSVDELNSVIGMAACIASDKIQERLRYIQSKLHELCADLATPADSKQENLRFSNEGISKLEDWIDEYDSELPPLKNFILAGGTELAGRLHFARTVSRRAERDVFEHSLNEKTTDSIIVFLNRLSDFFFVLARYANQKASVPDVVWKS